MKVVIISVLVCSVAVGLALYFKTEDKNFNKNEWKLSNHCKPVDKADLRAKMINDLTLNILKGKRLDEILELLGEPEEEKVLPNIKRDLLYCVGRPYGLTMSWLVIHLDENKNFKDFEIIKAD